MTSFVKLSFGNYTTFVTPEKSFKEIVSLIEMKTGLRPNMLYLKNMKTGEITLLYSNITLTLFWSESYEKNTYEMSDTDVVEEPKRMKRLKKPVELSDGVIKKAEKMGLRHDSKDTFFCLSCKENLTLKCKDDDKRTL